MEVPESWVNHVPKESTIKDGINVLWDMYIITYRKVPHNKPDIIVHNENTRECHIIDIAVPACRNIVQKKGGKNYQVQRTKYQITKMLELKESKYNTSSNRSARDSN